MCLFIDYLNRYTGTMEGNGEPGSNINRGNLKLVFDISLNWIALNAIQGSRLWKVAGKSNEFYVRRYWLDIQRLSLCYEPSKKPCWKSSTTHSKEDQIIQIFKLFILPMNFEKKIFRYDYHNLHILLFSNVI